VTVIKSAFMCYRGVCSCRKYYFDI